MKRVLVTYGDDKYQKAKEMLISSAKRMHYFDEIYGFSPEDIDVQFFREHLDILSVQRGNGLWLWKPYFVKKVLEQIEYGDILFYCDSGAVFLKSPRALECEFEDVFVSDIPLLEIQFTKKTVFEKLNVSCCDMESNQIIATYFIIRKTEKSEQLIDKWLELCMNETLIFPSNGEGELPEFVSHREDQSLLSILCKQEGIEAKWDITQRGKLPYTYWNSSYKFKIPNHGKRLGVYLFLHKQPNPIFGSTVLLYARQIKANWKFRCAERKSHNAKNNRRN